MLPSLHEEYEAEAAQANSSHTAEAQPPGREIDVGTMLDLLDDTLLSI